MGVLLEPVRHVLVPLPPRGRHVTTRLVRHCSDRKARVADRFDADLGQVG
jgi:hypothetical protein